MSFDNMQEGDADFVAPTEHVPSTAPDHGDPMFPCAECGKKMPFGPHVITEDGTGYCSLQCSINGGGDKHIIQGGQPLAIDVHIPRPTDGILEEYRVAEAKKRSDSVRAAADKITRMMDDEQNGVPDDDDDDISCDFDQEGENPKHAMGISKVPILSVVPTTAITYIALAMRYGAFEAVKKDGSKGYGPYNWRETKIYASVYVDAAMRHIMAVWDGEWLDSDSGVPHIGHAMACLALWADAFENGTLVDDRPMQGTASEMFKIWKKTP